MCAYLSICTQCVSDHRPQTRDGQLHQTWACHPVIPVTVIQVAWLSPTSLHRKALADMSVALGSRGTNHTTAAAALRLRKQLSCSHSPVPRELLIGQVDPMIHKPATTHLPWKGLQHRRTHLVCYKYIPSVASQVRAHTVTLSVLRCLESSCIYERQDWFAFYI